MARRRPGGGLPAAARRLPALGAGLAPVAGLVAVAGVARAVVLAAGLAVCAGLVWGLFRWEALLFGTRPSPSQALVRPEVLAGPAHRPAGGGLGSEGHRDFARGLAGLSAWYLAECEQETGR